MTRSPTIHMPASRHHLDQAANNANFSEVFNSTNSLLFVGEF